VERAGLGRVIHAAVRGSLCAVGLAFALGFGLGGPAQAQGAMLEERCKTIMTIVAGIVHEYHGQISADLISDLQKKIGTEGKCDGPDEYRVWPNTKDKEALSRIRQLIAVWDACKKDPAREGCK
jgi:hypothetical protein